MIDTHKPPDLHTLVRDKIDAWHAGQTPDASRLLAEFPALRNAKSLVLDLALAEYSLRTAAGDQIAKSDFCDRFPAYRQSIAKLLEVQEFLDQCPQFAVNDATRWPLPGEEFLGFEIVEPLGRGGMARVFLARQPELGNRQVVIKVSRFASREAHTLGKLSHPSIMPVFSVERDDSAGWTAICMPLLGAATAVDLLDAAFRDGVTREAELIHRVASETKPLAASAVMSAEEFDWNFTYSQAVARLGLQLAESLSAAHSAGILHRDIKPSNVLLAWSGRPILLDFNLSSDADAMVQGVGGTLAYMAPELIASVLNDKGQAARQFDPRYDIYSLGAVLYELLTGRLPAKPADAERLPLDAYEPWLECKRQSPAPLTMDSEIDGANQTLHNIVLKCLSFDPADRFATADELAQTLLDCFDSTTKSDAAPEPTAAPKLSRRTIFASVVGLATVILIALGLGFAFAAYTQPRQMPVELLYQQAVEEYEAGKYEAAVATFTKCLEQKSGWPDALFGRGQALVQLKKLDDARIDFMALRNANAAWSYALAGDCFLRAGNDTNASFDFVCAYEQGQRDVSFLLNYARVLSSTNHVSDAIRIYSDVISLQPLNRIALSNRALMGVALVTNHKVNLPSAESFSDAEQYHQLETEGFRGPLCAAVVYGEAARKDESYREKALGYWTDALRKGLPIETASRYRQAKSLMPLIDEAVRDQVAHDPEYRVSFTPRHEYGDTPRWQSFLQRRQKPVPNPALARGT